MPLWSFTFSGWSLMAFSFVAWVFHAFVGGLNHWVLHIFLLCYFNTYQIHTGSPFASRSVCYGPFHFGYTNSFLRQLTWSRLFLCYRFGSHYSSIDPPSSAPLPCDERYLPPKFDECRSCKMILLHVPMESNHTLLPLLHLPTITN